MNSFKITLDKLLTIPLNHYAYQMDTFNDNPMPYLNIEANPQELQMCQQALDDSIQQHPVRLMTSVLLYHPQGYRLLNTNVETPSQAIHLIRPVANQPEPDTMMESFFERFNALLEQHYLPKRERRVSNKPYHAITKRISPYYTVVVFLFNKSEYGSLGRKTGRNRYLRTNIMNAWCQTIGVPCQEFGEFNAWIRVSDALTVNGKTDHSQADIEAMHFQLAWLAHASLGNAPVTYWRY